MEKAPDALLTIGEMAKRLNVKTHILRYWEEQFPMLQPLKRAGGRRLYRPADVRLLEQIQDLLGAQGFTIRGARTHLQKGGVAKPTPLAPAPATTFVTPLAAADLSKPIADLRAIRSRLATALQASA
jgi:DNA-binding transcriptional MerR regulator